MKKTVNSSAPKCEYLIGDDICRAVRESDKYALRADNCHNETRDACCYTCHLREGCEISCDLLEKSETGELPRNVQASEHFVASNFELETQCGNCAYYLKQKCPRDYDRDSELWRRQAPCDIFQPLKRTERLPDR